MNLLFVEDDDDKAERIAAVVTTRVPVVQLSRAKSFDSALRRIVQDRSNLDGILLDMSMPNYDNSESRPEAFAGRDLLKQFKLRRISIPTIVITMFDLFGAPPDQLTFNELDDQLKTEFAPIYVGMIYYSSAQEGWKNELLEMIERIK
ncbi:response regulator transcription factor [Hydrogenophaga aromaticivorans]|uniref:response regulator transcription factor n=1 Tax=Hydrogenophaga aromaticivorans TaxID=2610898 RepID=UPI001B359A22|nr:response regulator transcription factor [Hydrogenophaga aromaticivorans]MBQ0921405.1 response regulator transcription factor [Hydrogenophaga aromaticivorans]